MLGLTCRRVNSLATKINNVTPAVYSEYVLNISIQMKSDRFPMADILEQGMELDQ